jgi:hypothetical protein
LEGNQERARETRQTREKKKRLQFRVLLRLWRAILPFLLSSLHWYPYESTILARILPVVTLQRFNASVAAVPRCDLSRLIQLSQSGLGAARKLVT